MTTAEQVALVLTDEDMREPRLAPTGGGRAVVFSARAPDKDGPNEDSVGVLAVDSRTAVLAVADGMGGQPAGESASKITMRCLRKSLEQAAESGPSLRGAILDALERANERVIGLGIGAATTFAALEISGGISPATTSAGSGSTRAFGGTDLASPLVMGTDSTR